MEEERSNGAGIETTPAMIRGASSLTHGVHRADDNELWSLWVIVSLILFFFLIFLSTKIGVGGCQAGSSSFSAISKILIFPVILDAGDKALPYETTNAMEALLNCCRSWTPTTLVSSASSPCNPASFVGCESWIGRVVSLRYLDLKKKFCGLAWS